MKESSTNERQDNGALVTLLELGPYVGGSEAVARALAEERGIRILEDWAGRPAVTIADARALRLAWTASWAETQRRSDAYEAWRERRKAEHLAKLQAEMARERERMEKQAVRENEERQREMRAAFEARARVKAEADRRFVPDLSREAYERETGM